MEDIIQPETGKLNQVHTVTLPRVSPPTGRKVVRKSSSGCPFTGSQPGLWIQSGGAPTSAPSRPPCLPESAVWEPAEEIQKQQRVAEAVGGLHEFLPLLLQITPGRCPGWVLKCPPPAPSVLGRQAAFLWKDVELEPPSQAMQRYSHQRPLRSKWRVAFTYLLKRGFYLEKGHLSAGWTREGGWLSQVADTLVSS